jgi:hypothetical protein
LNAAGIASINVAGKTFFSVKNYSTDSLSPFDAPPTSGNVGGYAEYYSSVSESYKPYLLITYTQSISDGFFFLLIK